MTNIQMTVVDCGPLSPEKAKIVAFAEGTVNNRAREFSMPSVRMASRTKLLTGPRNEMNCFPDAMHVMQPHQAKGT